MKRIFGLTPMNVLLIVLVIVVAYFLLNNKSNVAEGFEVNTTAIVIGSLVGVAALIIIGIWAISRY